jgi:hypothetical protein
MEHVRQVSWLLAAITAYPGLPILKNSDDGEISNYTSYSSATASDLHRLPYSVKTPCFDHLTIKYR